MKRFVIYNKEYGIYLGSCLGLGFWSLLDPVGQTAAITFDSVETIRNFMASWCSVPMDCSFREVIADDGHFASVAACIAAGLPGWDPNADGKAVAK